jgi:hypothetical protein
MNVIEGWVEGEGMESEVSAVEAKGNPLNSRREGNDESAMTFEPCRLADLVKIEITTNHNFKSTKQLYWLVPSYMGWLHQPLRALV